eukprot:CAMPEP_0202894548 /NCGR_PEP_ID=MMETSP1392-20130828/3934_1 /ASSEMBLY_ACC=CAM_ASM_000868 /TAXON_ID=225041 /ORGANISM="Chlamydomonas chlamydogama, Strain SAG 11-48b" /LENGTH=497 /DNA_ID=CAMNT_0049579277 /DNA_START=245 /DNA_END=1738 /DNA_ORIENTATION=-
MGFSKFVMPWTEGKLFSRSLSSGAHWGSADNQENKEDSLFPTAKRQKLDRHVYPYGNPLMELAGATEAGCTVHVHARRPMQQQFAGLGSSSMPASSRGQHDLQSGMENSGLSISVPNSSYPHAAEHMEGVAADEELPEDFLTPQNSAHSLDSPQPDANVTLGVQPFIGCHTFQNMRPYQEDRLAYTVTDDGIHMGMFDGHAGASTSSFLQAHLLSTIDGKMQSCSDVRSAIEDAFLSTNLELRQRGAYSCGSTATTVLIEGTSLICANSGDSPAFVVMQSGEVFLLTVDHNPNTNQEERVRVEAAGGRIEKMCWGERNKRVLSYDSMSGLAMTRAFGDFNFPGVICNPHVCTMDGMEKALYVVLASDGLTEAWSVEGAAQHVVQLSAAGLDPSDIAMHLVNQAKMQGSRDNISCIVLDVKAFQAARQANSQPQITQADATPALLAEPQQQPASQEDPAPAAAATLVPSPAKCVDYHEGMQAWHASTPAKSAIEVAAS